MISEVLVCHRCLEHVPPPWEHHNVNASIHGMRWHSVKCVSEMFYVFYRWAGWGFIGSFGVKVPPSLSTHKQQMRYAMALHSLVKKARAEKVKGGSVKDFSDPTWAEKWPFIHAFLTSTEGEAKGEVRLTSTLNFCLDDGVPKAILNDREEQCSLFASGDSWEAARDALEAKLAAGSKEWRAWQGKAKRKR
jgi:hypothetical protein